MSWFCFNPFTSETKTRTSPNLTEGTVQLYYLPINWHKDFSYYIKIRCNCRFKQKYFGPKIFWPKFFFETKILFVFLQIYIWYKNYITINIIFDYIFFQTKVFNKGFSSIPLVKIDLLKGSDKSFDIRVGLSVYQSVCPSSPQNYTKKYTTLKT